MPDAHLIQELTQLSPPAALALALYFVGKALKKSPVADWLIPFLLPLCVALVFPFLAETANVSYTVKSPAMFNAVVGFCIGGASVAVDQAVRQFRGRNTPDEPAP